MTESEENEDKSSAGCDTKIRGYYQNPYINYYVRLFDLEEFKGKPVTEVAKYAGQSWRNMQETEKQEYRDMTKLATKRRKRTNVKKKMVRAKPRIEIALRIKQEQEQRDENNNEETAGAESEETAGTESKDTHETCDHDETHSSSEAFVDNTEAAETCDAIQSGTETTWHSNSEDTLVCHDFCPRPPTPMPSECSQRVCLTPSRRRKRVREEESPPPAPKRRRTRERTTRDTSPTEMSTPKRTRNTDIYDLSTLKKATKRQAKETEGNVKGKERGKKKSAKRKLSFSSDSESVYSFEPKSKRKRMTKTYHSDGGECSQYRNNTKRTYAKARKQSDKSNVKRNKQAGGWYLNSSDERTTDSE
uniref:HMG box domain-containing protein n=1 Tax=Cacopsylla melanoneura TaxID=428564 RepID=A0A8D9FDF6_9HEMI